MVVQTRQKKGDKTSQNQEASSVCSSLEEKDERESDGESDDSQRRGYVAAAPLEGAGAELLAVQGAAIAGLQRVVEELKQEVAELKKTVVGLQKKARTGACSTDTGSIRMDAEIAQLKTDIAIVKQGVKTAEAAKDGANAITQALSDIEEFKTQLSRRDAQLQKERRKEQTVAASRLTDRQKHLYASGQRQKSVPSFFLWARHCERSSKRGVFLGGGLLPSRTILFLSSDRWTRRCMLSAGS